MTLSWFGSIYICVSVLGTLLIFIKSNESLTLSKSIAYYITIYFKMSVLHCNYECKY